MSSAEEEYKHSRAVAEAVASELEYWGKKQLGRAAEIRKGIEPLKEQLNPLSIEDRLAALPYEKVENKPFLYCPPEKVPEDLPAAFANGPIKAKNANYYLTQVKGIQRYARGR